jgi:hypothetical protein
MKELWPNLRYISGIFRDRGRKDTKHLNYDSSQPSRNLNRAPQEYKREALPFGPTCSVVQRRPFVYTVMDHWVPSVEGHYLTK